MSACKLRLRWQIAMKGAKGSQLGAFSLPSCLRDAAQPDAQNPNLFFFEHLEAADNAAAARAGTRTSSFFLIQPLLLA